MSDPVTHKKAGRAMDWPGVALALAVGAAGGAVFDALHLPLAWLLGAMVTTTAAAVLGLRVSLPTPAYTGANTVIGIVMGSAFSPEIFGHLARFSVTLAALLLYVVLIAAAMVALVRRLGGFDPRTAYFAAMPGGVAEMTVIGQSMGGDLRTIALFQGARILIVAFTVPMGFRFIAGYEPQGVSAVAGAINSIAVTDWLVFAGSILVGYFGGRLIRLPAPALLGVLIASAVAHLTGLTDAKLPAPLIALGQIVLGIAIGVRFVGAPPRLIGRMLAIATGVIGTMLLVTIAFSLALAWATAWPVEALILAYSPGGLPEMTLVALVMGIDVVFVATHHTVRIVFVVSMALPCLRLMERRRRRPTSGSQ